MTRTLREELVEVIRELPGITLPQILEFTPHVSRGAVTGMLSRMALEGMVVRGTKAREGDRGRATVHTYTLNPDPAARPPIPPKLKLRKPTAAGYDEQIASLRAEVASLRQWKADAIARFPDLDVDPVVLEARRIVADEIGTSDPHLAQQVLDGKKDTILPMRVTINALNKGN